MHRSLNSNEKGPNIWANVLLQKPVIIGNQVKFPLAVTQNLNNNVALHIEHRCINPTVFTKWNVTPLLGHFGGRVGIFNFL